MSYFDTIVELGDKFSDLAINQKAWSEMTFGSDQERGPIGALKHLELEAREAQADPTNAEEYADCFLLILDAARRAGIKPMQLLEAAQRKQEINRRRKWPAPTSDEPVEHIREETPFAPLERIPNDEDVYGSR